MSTRPVTLIAYAYIYGASNGNQWIADNLANVMRSNGWSVNIHIEDAPQVANGAIAIFANAQVDTSYFDTDIVGSFQSNLAQAGINNLITAQILSDSNYTPFNTPSGGTNNNTSNQNNTSNNTTTHSMPDALTTGLTNGSIKYLGVSGGVNVYKDAHGCFTYDMPYSVDGSATDIACPAGNWLESIGNSLGVTKFGVTAAAGGAIVLVAVAFLFTRNK